jgi:tetratricopeptide (TPR) repeat protein
MRKKMLLLLVLTWHVSYSVEAQPAPGWAAPKLKLSQIAPAELQQACLWLEQRKMNEARSAFEELLKKDNRSYVAAYGWLQTTTAEERKRLSRSYEKVLKQSPTAMNYFKASILYLYLAYDTDDIAKRGPLFLRCSEYASKAYQLDPNPYMVILFDNCPVPGLPKMFEEQMGSILGEESMRVYLQAKQRRWQFDKLPPVKHLDLHRLQLLRAIVRLAYPYVLEAEGGWICENKPDPVDPQRIHVLGRYTPLGTRIRAYFRKWLTAIDQALRSRRGEKRTHFGWTLTRKNLA